MKMRMETKQKPEHLQLHVHESRKMKMSAKGRKRAEMLKKAVEAGAAAAWSFVAEYRDEQRRRHDLRREKTA